MAIEIRLLDRSDDRSSFRSGNADLDSFFRQYAGQNQFRHHIGNTYVAVEDDRILGFTTLAPGSIEINRLPARLKKALPIYPIPVLRVGRLAVSLEAQSRGIGRRLMKAAFLMALDLRAKLGCVGVVVDAKSNAEAFYASLGFEPLDVIAGSIDERPAPRSMFLSIREIERATRAD